MNIIAMVPPDLEPPLSLSSFHCILSSFGMDICICIFRPSQAKPNTQFSTWQIRFPHTTYFPLRRQTAIYDRPYRTVLRVRFVDPSRPPMRDSRISCPAGQGTCLVSPCRAKSNQDSALRVRPDFLGRIHSSLTFTSIPVGRLHASPRSLRRCVGWCRKPTTSQQPDQTKSKL